MIMRKIPAVLPFIILLLFHSVSAGSPHVGDDFMERFITAVNSDNYSLIEPYMSDQLKAQFTRDYFEEVRELTLKNYGRLISYTYEGNETEGEIVRLKYTVKAERGSFPVLLAYRDGKLVGLALGIRPKPNPTGMMASMGGTLLALLGLYAWRRRLSLPEIALGSGLALALSIVIPFYSITGTLLLPRSAAIVIVSLLTSLTVEGGKYYLSKNRDGFSLGLGLGLGQFILLALGTFVATNFIMKLPVSFTGSVVPLFLEAFIFTVFYALSTEIYSRKRALRFFLAFTALEFLALGLLNAGRVYESLLFITVGIGVALKLRG